MRLQVMLAAPALLALVIGEASAADPVAHRFRLDATLAPVQQPAGDARFRVLATLQQHARPAAVSGSRLVVAATLAPAGAPICYGPGSVFADGFEQD